MGDNATAKNAASMYAPAQGAVNQAQTNAENLAAMSTPKNYVFDPYQVNKNAALLSRVQVLQNQKALQDRSPEAAAAQEDAIKTLSGGVPGDDAFLNNAALKAGLQGGVATGAIGPNAPVTPGGRGGATVANIFGQNLLNYRDQRAGQAMGVAAGLQPDAAVSPGNAISAMEGSKQGAIGNQNNWQTFLSNLRFGQVQNLNNQNQQSMGVSQNVLNANVDAANASRAQAVASGVQLGSAIISSAGQAMSG